MSKPSQEPTKNDLLCVVGSFCHAESPAVEKLLAAKDAASEAVDKFEKESKVYQSLLLKKSAASDAYYEASKKWERLRSRRLDSVRNAIRSKGVTPHVLKLVEQLIEEMS